MQCSAAEMVGKGENAYGKEHSSKKECRSNLGASKPVRPYLLNQIILILLRLQCTRYPGETPKNPFETLASRFDRHEASCYLALPFLVFCLWCLSTIRERRFMGS